MWKPEHRDAAEPHGLRYPSDLSDAEWALVEPMISPAKHGGRPRDVNVREVLNANLLRAVDWLPVAGIAEGPAAEEHSALLLHGVEMGRCVACARRHRPPHFRGLWSDLGRLKPTRSVAGAVANTVWHATGVRVRKFPITLDRVIEPQAR